VKRIGVVFCVVVTWLLSPSVGWTQVSSDLACSGGPRDGAACRSDDDCFVSCPTSFGACVVIQGVCDGGDFDGFPCDCPGGTCVGTGAEGICQGGAFAGDPCRTVPGEGTCGARRACVGTQKVCTAGEFRGFGCLRAAHCPGGSCSSTGRFCDGGDFEFYSCAVSADCNLPTPGRTPGVCRTPDFGCPVGSPTPTRTRPPTASPTPRPFSPTPTVQITVRATPTRTPGSPGPSPATPTRTVTAVPTTPQLTPPGTPATPRPNQAVVAQPATKGADRVVVQQPESVPLTGQITYIGNTRTCTSFIRRAGSDVLAINPPLPEDVAPGTMLTFGPCGIENTFVQESCAVAAPGAASLGAQLLGFVLLWIRTALRRRGHAR
jgi:hypothetical protein